MKTKMKFHVILTIDVYNDGWKLSSIKPKIVQYPLFYKTESTPDEDYIKIHRKYCGTLSADEFITLVSQMNISYSCDTMGSLTLEYGYLPAISLDDNDGEWNMNIYVSPVFDNQTEEKIQEVLGSITETSRNIILDTTTGPHFDRFMELLKHTPDSDALDELRILSEKELDIQPMLALTV